MISQQDRVRHLNEALARAVPKSLEWIRRTSASIPAPASESVYSIEIQSPVRPESQRLVILLRQDGDIQVEYHIANKKGTPFEVLFPLCEGQEGEVIENVSAFVADLLSERLVLAYAKRWLKGGRRFLVAQNITESERRTLRWITSWLGTYDWES